MKLEGIRSIAHTFPSDVTTASPILSKFNQLFYGLNSPNFIKSTHNFLSYPYHRQANAAQSITPANL